MNCINDTSLENDTDPDIHSLDSVANVSSASKLVNYYVTDVAMPATCALGILGNLLSLMVLTTEKLHRTLSKMEISAHIGLTALAVSDFLFCLLVLIVTQ
ncbi:G-protein coupled receptor 84, partial [Biomphalaria glabrata]